MLAQAPSTFLVRPEVHDVTGAHGSGTRRGRHHQAAGVVDGSGSPDQFSRGQSNPDPMTQGATPLPHLVGQRPPPRPVLQQRTPGFQGPEER